MKTDRGIKFDPKQSVAHAAQYPLFLRFAQTAETFSVLRQDHYPVYFRVRSSSLAFWIPLNKFQPLGIRGCGCSYHLKITISGSRDCARRSTVFVMIVKVCLVPQDDDAALLDHPELYRPLRRSRCQGIKGSLRQHAVPSSASIATISTLSSWTTRGPSGPLALPKSLWVICDMTPPT